MDDVAELAWCPGSATGVGSWPGEDPLEASRVIFGEQPDLPYLPELPGRGPGTDMVGRTAAAALAGMDVDLFAGRWRLTPRPGMDVRRARATFARDVDAFEEAASGHAGPVKVQLSGPWTLAARVELPGGGPALADFGASRDLTESLAEGVDDWLRELRRRLPENLVVLQLDEPELPAVLSGAVPTMSGFARIPAVEPQPVQEGLERALRAATAAGAWPVVHCCSADVPLRLLADAGARALSVDIGQLTPAADDAVGELVESGTGMLVGCVPSADPTVAPEIDGVVSSVRSWWSRIGLTTDQLATRTAVTPACGLAGATPAWARQASALAVRVGRTLADR